MDRGVSENALVSTIEIRSDNGPTGNSPNGCLTILTFLRRRSSKIALDPKTHWIVAPPSTPHRCFGIRAFAPLSRLVSMKTVFILCVFVLAFISVSNLGAAYSRFGGAESAEQSPVMSLNQQILAGQPLRFYGRFRNGNDDILTRYLNRF